MSGMSADRPVAKPSRLSKDPVGCERWKKTTGYIRKNIWNWRCQKVCKGDNERSWKGSYNAWYTSGTNHSGAWASSSWFAYDIFYVRVMRSMQKQNFWFLPTCLPPRVGSQLRDLSPFCPKNRTSDSCLHTSLATKQKHHLQMSPKCPSQEYEKKKTLIWWTSFQDSGVKILSKYSAELEWIHATTFWQLLLRVCSVPTIYSHPQTHRLDPTLSSTLPRNVTGQKVNVQYMSYKDQRIMGKRPDQGTKSRQFRQALIWCFCESCTPCFG